MSHATIDCVRIVCNAHDVWLTRVCVSSIRWWYPDVPISLVKDHTRGPFDTRELERRFGCTVHELSGSRFGLWTKIVILLHPQRERFLLLDSDIIFCGPVLDLLQQYPADFVVCADSSLNPGTPWFRRTYYEIEEVQRITPGFSFPGYAFNAGQYVGTSGILRREHFEKYLEFALTIRARHPNALKNADQGVLNVVIPSAASRGDVSLGKADFLVWAWSKSAQAISLSDIERKQGVPSVLHYAGPKPLRLSKSPRYNLLRFFEDRYYEQSGEGKLKRLRHKWARWAEGAKWYSRILANRGLAGSAKGTFTRILKRGVKSSLW